MPRFAANLSTLFSELPVPARFAAAADAGFSLIEFQFPYLYAPIDFAERMAGNGLEMTLFNLNAGDWTAGERGFAALPGRGEDFDRSLELALGYARMLDVSRLHALAGIAPEGADPKLLATTYRHNIGHAARTCAAQGHTLLIEPINTHDMPGYYLSDFGAAIEHIAAIAERGGPPPRLQFDIYHCARIHGDVLNWIERCAPYVGYYQIAGVPGRHEPNSDTLALNEIFEAIDSLTPGTPVGLEYFPKAGTKKGLDWLTPYLG